MYHIFFIHSSVDGHLGWEARSLNHWTTREVPLSDKLLEEVGLLRQRAAPLEPWCVPHLREGSTRSPAVPKAESLFAIGPAWQSFSKVEAGLVPYLRAGLAETAGPSPEFCHLFLRNWQKPGPQWPQGSDPSLVSVLAPS